MRSHILLPIDIRRLIIVRSRGPALTYTLKYLYQSSDWVVAIPRHSARSHIQNKLGLLLYIYNYISLP